MSLEQTKLVECSLHDYSQALMLTQHWSREQVFLDEYFGKQAYTTTEEYVSPYHHNLAQWVMKKFFEQKGLKLVLETNLNMNGVAPVMEDIQCDLNETFKGYSHAAVGYEDAAGKRVLITMDRQDEKEVSYKISAVPEYGTLLKEWLDYGSKNNMYKGKKITAGCRFLDLKDVTWDDVILPPNLIALLKGLISVSIKHRRIFKKNKLSQKRGILMEGAPGNGKTTTIKVIIKEVPADVSVILAQPSHLRHAGDIRSVCQMAKDLAPSIMVVEDLDWIAEDRNHAGDAGRVIELMNQMDGVEEMDGVITIGTTNDVEKIEKAIKNRPGRFDRVIKIENPDEDCRRRMLKQFTQHWNVDAGIDWEHVVKFTEKLSGAHMGDLCITAAHKAVEAESWDENEILILKNEHFADAIKEVKDKNYSSYMESKGKEKKPMGFTHAWDDDDM